MWRNVFTKINFFDLIFSQSQPQYISSVETVLKVGCIDSTVLDQLTEHEPFKMINQVVKCCLILDLLQRARGSKSQYLHTSMQFLLSPVLRASNNTEQPLGIVKLEKPLQMCIICCKCASDIGHSKFSRQIWKKYYLNVNTEWGLQEHWGWT